MAKEKPQKPAKGNKRTVEGLTQREKDEILTTKSGRASGKRRKATKIIIVVLICALLITGAAWGVLSVVEANSLRIDVDKSDMGGLSLSLTKDFAKPLTSLRIAGPANIGDVTFLEKISVNGYILGKEGAHHGAEFIACSFFIRNDGAEAINFSEDVVLTRREKNMDKAIRFMVVRYSDVDQNPIPTVYASVRSDGIAEALAYAGRDDNIETQLPITLEELNAEVPNFFQNNMTTPFFGVGDAEKPEDKNGNPFYICRTAPNALAAGEARKYTVVMWVEGTDSDCKDDVLQGCVSFRLDFKVLAAQ